MQDDKMMNELLKIMESKAAKKATETLKQQNRASPNPLIKSKTVKEPKHTSPPNTKS